MDRSPLELSVVPADTNGLRLQLAATIVHLSHVRVHPRALPKVHRSDGPRD